MTTAQRPHFILNVNDRLVPFEDGGFADMGGAGTRLGEIAGLTAFGVNYEVSPPESRSSFPHAESCEEEFVLVLGGTPDLWLDGVLYPLGPGDAVGFPAGTGIAHSFLNNGVDDMALLIVGEHEVAGNQLWYPLNPERMAEFERDGRAWLDGPRPRLGPHDGKAVTGGRSGDGPARPDFVAHYSERLKVFDNGGNPDMAREMARLGKSFGLTRLGINYEILPPGRRTSLPHAEKLEDELIYVVSGTPDIWVDGVLHPLGPGDAAGFPKGTGIAHSVLNNSAADAHLVVIGEHHRPGNQWFYPLDPRRMKIMSRMGAAWIDAPVQELGGHDGVPRAGTRES